MSGSLLLKFKIKNAFFYKMRIKFAAQSVEKVCVCVGGGGGGGGLYTF